MELRTDPLPADSNQHPIVQIDKGHWKAGEIVEVVHQRLDGAHIDDRAQFELPRLARRGLRSARALRGSCSSISRPLLFPAHQRPSAPVQTRTFEYFSSTKIVPHRYLVSTRRLNSSLRAMCDERNAGLPNGCRTRHNACVTDLPVRARAEVPRRTRDDGRWWAQLEP